METRVPTVENDGIVAFHDQACAVFYDREPAVFDCNKGFFHPSWAAQKEGWHLVQANTRFQRGILRAIFGVDA